MKKRKLIFGFDEVSPEIQEQLAVLKEAIQEGDQAGWKVGDAVVELRKRFFKIHKRKLPNTTILAMLDKQVKFKTRQRVGQVGDRCAYYPEKVRDYSIDPIVYEAARVANEKLKEKKHAPEKLVKLIQKYPDAEQIKQVLLKGTNQEKPFVHTFDVTIKAKDISNEAYPNTWDYGTPAIRFDGLSEFPSDNGKKWMTMLGRAAGACLSAAAICCARSAKKEAGDDKAKFWDAAIHRAKIVRQFMSFAADFVLANKDIKNSTENEFITKLVLAYGSLKLDWNGAVYQKAAFIKKIQEIDRLGVDVSDFNVELTDQEQEEIERGKAPPAEEQAVNMNNEAA